MELVAYFCGGELEETRAVDLALHPTTRKISSCVRG
eukprot:COSAG01_NODE_67709_length_266_cov_0.622754_1_plen_35_part_01